MQAIMFKKVRKTFGYCVNDAYGVGLAGYLLMLVSAVPLFFIEVSIHHSGRGSKRGVKLVRMIIYGLNLVYAIGSSIYLLVLSIGIGKIRVLYNVIGSTVVLYLCIDVIWFVLSMILAFVLTVDMACRAR